MDTNIIYGVKGVEHLYEPEEQKGIALIKTFEFKASNDPMFNMRNTGLFRMMDGKYVKLYVGNDLMMSDTPMERMSNRHFINNANGRVLIAGLGVGLIIQNIIDKEEVKEVIVIEKYQDVIDLVHPKIEHPKLKIIHCDIFDFRVKNELFDVIYFDIWPDITEDNLIEIKQLHNRWKNKLNRINPKSWMNSWMKEHLQAQKRRNSYRY